MSVRRCPLRRTPTRPRMNIPWRVFSCQPRLDSSLDRRDHHAWDSLLAQATGPDFRPHFGVAAGVKRRHQNSTAITAVGGVTWGNECSSTRYTFTFPQVTAKYRFSWKQENSIRGSDADLSAAAPSPAGLGSRPRHDSATAELGSIRTATKMTPQQSSQVAVRFTGQQLQEPTTRQVPKVLAIPAGGAPGLRVSSLAQQVRVP